MQTLARRLGFISLLLYGIGDILGAGIYALVGRVIGQAGSAAWISFLIAALAALLTGFSYAEMTRRYPVAGGAAIFVRRALPGKLIATLIGVLVLGTGIVSAATVTVAFSGYLSTLVPLPATAGRLLVLGFISSLSFWGIRESARVNALFTAVEFTGLLAVIVVGFSLITTDPERSWERLVPEAIDLSPIFAGTTIAFFAFIGFEDLCNLAEEAKNPSRDLPRAILSAICVTTVVYLLVTLVLMATVSRQEISGSETPLLLVFQKAGLKNITALFSLVALLAITNTGLANLIMASRLLYGMSKEDLLPSSLSLVHEGRKTPWVGVVVSGLLVLILVFTGSVRVLAQTTSLLILLVFVMVHLSLIIVIRRDRSAARGLVFPIVGASVCFVLLFHFPGEVYLRALILPAAGILVWFWHRPR